MLVARDRVYYSGLLGRRMSPRRLGGAALYVAPSGPFRIRQGDGPWRETEIALVPPFQPHQLASDDKGILDLLIESDRVAPGALADLAARLEDPVAGARMAARMRRAGPRLLSLLRADDLSAEDLDAETVDRLCLGRTLPARRLDPRIARVLDLFEDHWRTPIAAADCAAEAGLSTSRFLHLFKEETGASYRQTRSWKRARGFLRHANRSDSLTEVALDLGYPDSSHFSTSIRKTFGLMPRSIRAGSRDLRILAEPAEQGMEYA